MTITIFALVAAFTVGVKVSLQMALVLSIVATFSACGTSDDISMQLVGVGFIISVIQDSMETALNSSGDALFTATAEFMEWKKQGKKLPL